MAIVQSFGALQSLEDARGLNFGAGSGSVNLYGLNQAYAEIYRTQPNVRICVDFLARNIAHLGLHAFRRLSNTDRERLYGHDVIRWFNRPNPTTRRYRQVESLIGDLGVYFNAYLLKVRYLEGNGRRRIGFVRLPPEEMTVVGGLLPREFQWTALGRKRSLALSEVVYFNGYNPKNPLMGLSPLETLRRILAEEAAAGAHRESYWRNASRHEGIIERPLAAPRWSPEQKRDWRSQYQERFAGAENSGQVPVLEDGMTFKATSFSARDSEYTVGGKLRREIVAAQYHIPQPMVGILEHATFSNVREQHKHLYQDCLGPWLEMIVEELEGQVLTECEDQTDVYLEFNIAAKLAGSFEEQATSISTLTGRPVMTANEGRGKLNLPAMTDDPSADELAAQQGGPAGYGGPPPQVDDESDAEGMQRTGRRIATALDVRPVLEATRRRQHARLERIAAEDRPFVFSAQARRWNRELETNLLPLVGDPAVARSLAAQANAATLTRLQDEAAL